MKQLVFGILAHVDSGKTTLTEGLLYRAGEIRRLGRVDHGDAFLDSHQLERERGITIFAKQATLQVGESRWTLLDTPGHVDFSAEMERTLQVLDYAILVISGSAGVQSHTETLWQLLARYRVPTFLFINKMDLAGADREQLMAGLKSRLGESCVDFSAPGGLWQEEAALCEEELMERYLNQGELELADLREAVAQRKLFPCWFGSALRLQGVDEFLQGVEPLTRMPAYPAEFAAQVFKIGEDSQGGRLTHLKITGGSLRVRSTLTGRDARGEEWSEKVNQIRIYSGDKYQSAEEVSAGTVCAVTGLTHTRPGEGLGAAADAQTPVLQPVLTYRVELPPKTDAHTALGKLRRLEEEDPQLHVVWSEPHQQIHMQLMGEVQLEVLERIIWERFQLAVTFGQGDILYKETILHPVEGVGHFEPLRHYAEVHLLLEPGERGSGLVFATDCREEDLDRNWQRLVLTHLEEKTHLGVLTGSPITDMRITLLTGRAHVKHTEGGDFRQATYRAVRQGLASAQSQLLEPWYVFRLAVPQENVGRAMSDLQRMNGTVSPPEPQGELSVLTGSAPVAALRDYQKEVTGYTRGRGQLTCTLEGYAPCRNAQEVIEAIGYRFENDLENPADSVFCSHGVGHTVKWNQVREQMHVDSGWGEERPAQGDSPMPQAPIWRQRSWSIGLEEDKELMAIFERTYGPIRQEPRTAFRSIRERVAQSTPYRAKPIPDGPEYLLVDGYNILFAWEDLKALALENLDAARSQLINLLCNYQAFRQCEVILVFDAYKVKGGLGEVERHHNIHVVYTKEAETADMYIEKVTRELGKKHRVRVATSDGLEQMIILGHGALRMSATALREEVEQVDRAIREFLRG